MRYWFVFKPVTGEAASFWFGTDEVGIQKNAELIFLKEAKAAAFQLRSLAGCGGDYDELKRANEMLKQAIADT